MALRRVRILHLSDLHERGSRESEPWRRRRVLGDAWDENVAELLQDGPIDLVCFTGDAADWGEPEEFARATEFLNGLLERLRVPPEHLFVVPGNHDVARGVHPQTWEKVREAAGAVDPLALARWLHGRETPFGFEPDWRSHLFARLGAYRSWVREGLGRGELCSDGEADHPHSYRVSLEFRGVPVHIVGLDSAWLCGADDDASRLRITDEQVMARLTEDGRDLEGLRLVLVHHPLDDLESVDREAVRRCLAEHADLVLRGHLHAPEVSSWADPDRQVRQLAAGCLYEGHRADRYPNACQVLTLELDSGGGAAVAEVRLRSFSPRGGHWFDDGCLYREASDGRLRFSVGQGRATATGAGANPFDPFNPVVPPRFVGRTAELSRLESSLSEGHGVSIVGDWRIGKSSLLQTWEQRAKALGRTVVLLDGQGAEGASIEALVGKILGQPAPEGADAAADALGAWADQSSPGLASVILIDELDGLIARLDPRFFERLRELLGRVILTVASRRPVDLLFQYRGLSSPFHNRLRVLRLGLLEPTAAEEIARLGSELVGEERDLMRRWAGRHPFHLQLFGYCLAEARRLGQRREEALDSYLDTAYPRLRELWNRLDAREQDTLKATLHGRPAKLRSLRRRGLVDDQGQLFGEVLAAWLREAA